MRIRAAIGLGIVIVILKVLTPVIYAAFAGTLVALFQTTHETLDVAASVIRSIDTSSVSP